MAFPCDQAVLHIDNQSRSLYFKNDKFEFPPFDAIADDGLCSRSAATLEPRISSRLPLENLPPPPGRILVVGIDQGPLPDMLVERGYQVSLLTPDLKRFEFQGVSVRSLCEAQRAALADFSDSEAGFDAAVFQETARYLNAVDLFNKASDLLRLNGRVLIIDEVGLKREAGDEIASLPFLTYILAQAKRCGFDLVRRQDISDEAVLTLECLSKAFESRQDKNNEGLHVSEDLIRELTSILRRHRQEHEENRRGYLYLEWEKLNKPQWRIKAVTGTDDQLAIRNMFKEVFGYTMSADLWQWKYGPSHGMGTAVWKDRKMVGYYGGIIRDVLYFSRPVTAVQIADVMVAESERGYRRGPYYLSASTFPETYAGYASPILLGYGFPTTQAMRVAEAFKLYEEVGRIVELRWTAIDKKIFVNSTVRQLNPLNDPADQEIVDRLWAAMAADFPDAVIGTRNWEFVKHRYYDHPEKSYELFLVVSRFSNKPLGIGVLLCEEGLCRLIDVIAPLKNLRILIRQIRSVLGRRNIPALSMWITENFRERFADTGCTYHPQEVRIPHCVCYQGPSAEQVRDKWWLTWGDSDFM